MIRNLFERLNTRPGATAALVRGNPAKTLIKEARGLVGASNRELGFERISLDLAESAMNAAISEDLRQIARWHRKRASEKLAAAVNVLRRAERCALSARFRRYAAMRLKKYEAQLARMSERESTDAGTESVAPHGIAGFLRSFGGKRAIVVSIL